MLHSLSGVEIISCDISIFNRDIKYSLTILANEQDAKALLNRHYF